MRRKKAGNISLRCLWTFQGTHITLHILHFHCAQTKGLVGLRCCVCRCSVLEAAKPGSPAATHTHTHPPTETRTVTAGCPGPGRPDRAQPIQTLWSSWSGKGPGSDEFVHANTSHFLWQNTTTCPSLKDPHSAGLEWPRYSPPGSFLLSEALLVSYCSPNMNCGDIRTIAFSIWCVRQTDNLHVGTLCVCSKNYNIEVSDLF